MTESLALPQSQRFPAGREQPAASWEEPPPLARVAVLGEGKLADIALPTDLPLREIIPTVRRLVAPGAGDEGDPEGFVPRADPARRLSLAPLGGAPFSLDATLGAVGIVDGDLLMLRPLPVGPAAASVVEDIADVAALEGSRGGPVWSATVIAGVARSVVVVFLLLLAAVAAGWWLHGGALPARASLAVAAALSVGSALYARFRAPRSATALSVAALLPVLAACASAVPGPPGAAHALLAAAGVAAWSVLCLLLPAREGTVERAEAFFAGAATFALAVLLVCGAQILWLGVPSSDSGGRGVPWTAAPCLLILFGLAATVAAPSLSVLLSRLPLPDLPAPGDPLPAAPKAEGLADLPRRARRAAAVHTGLVAGATLALVLGALCLLPAAFCSRLGAVGDWATYVALAALAATALRARVPAGTAAKAWLVTAPVLAGACGAVFAAQQGQWLWALAMVGVVGLFAVLWLLVAARPALADAEGYSLPARRVVHFVALALDASLIPVIAYVCGVFQWVLAG